MAALDDFKLSDEETVVLQVVKYWLMSQDIKAEKNGDRHTKKTKIRDEYRAALRQSYAAEQTGEDVPPPTAQALQDRIGAPGWPSAVRGSLIECEKRKLRALLDDWEFVSALLATTTRRDRAVLLTVELAAFHPWTEKLHFDKDVRESGLVKLAGAFGSPLGPDYVKQLDHELHRRARNLALRANWKRIALISGGGLTLGAITGGLAAPLIGGAIGGAMGLSGIAATNAGLALLGGGSLAAGGFGVAGGTLVVAGVGGVGAGAAAGSTDAFHTASAAVVINDMAKLDLLTEYVFIRERSEPEKAKTVVLATEQTVRATEAHINLLRNQIAQLGDLLRSAEARLDALDGQSEELQSQNADLKDKLTESEAQLKAARAAAKVYEAEAHSLRAKLNAIGVAA